MPKLIFASAILVFSSLAHAKVDYEVVRNADRTLVTMNRAAAEQACAERQAHLATARDFATIAQERGADGAREARRPNQPAVTELSSADMMGANSETYMNKVAGFDQVLKRGENGNVIDFFYSRQHFKCWEGDLDHDFWTSTDLGQGATYLFLGRETAFPGAIRPFAVDANDEHAVLCVR